REKKDNRERIAQTLFHWDPEAGRADSNPGPNRIRSRVSAPSGDCVDCQLAPDAGSARGSDAATRSAATGTKGPEGGGGDAAHVEEFDCCSHVVPEP
ncbi:Hypothetical protein SMAX5B_007181, partial [Scophthalmus maximus]